MTEPQSPEANQPPLSGIRVLDFTLSLSGPYCCWLLACLGADVVKVEPPSGDYIRRSKNGTLFASVNRSKRSIAIDLRQASGQQLALEMVPSFDVIVESFRPGSMDKLGLGYDRVRGVNPGVIYASISGYGQTGPYAERPGYDVIAQALSGIMAATGEPGGQAVRIGTAAVDYGTGTYAALGIVAALRRRELTGEGARIDACLLETAISSMSYYYTHYSATGELPQRWGSANESFVPYQMFRAKDGEVFVGVGTDRMFRDFCAEFGLDEMGADPELATIAGRVANRNKVVSAVADILRELSVNDAMQKLVEAKIPTTTVLNVDETIRDEQVVARGAIAQLDDPILGPIKVTTFPLIMDGVPRAAGGPAPRIGEHTAQVLDELGLRPTRERPGY
jgi:crotonobetainyl-CoA:carnitine CoA-transferase CaiB-like acyl-CoA transferase